MDKKLLIDQIVSQLQNDLEVNMEAANEAREAAIHDESVPETQYDTLGLEASYLAHGQSKRVEELELDLAEYRNLALRDFDSKTPIGLSALITVEDEQGEQKHLLLGPAGGGVHIENDDYTVTVITPQSPIGKALVGCLNGDLVQLPQGEFEITEVI